MSGPWWPPWPWCSLPLLSSLQVLDVDLALGCGLGLTLDSQGQGWGSSVLSFHPHHALAAHPRTGALARLSLTAPCLWQTQCYLQSAPPPPYLGIHSCSPSILCYRPHGSGEPPLCPALPSSSPGASWALGRWPQTEDPGSRDRWPLSQPFRQQLPVLQLLLAVSHP